MNSLIYPTCDISLGGMDLVVSSCSKSRCGIPVVGFASLDYAKKARTDSGRFPPKRLSCKRKGIAQCEVSSVSSPDTLLNVNFQEPPFILDNKLIDTDPVSVSSILKVVADDLEILNRNLKEIRRDNSFELLSGKSRVSYPQFLRQRSNQTGPKLVGTENPLLVSAAEQIFGAGGKRLRPALVFLVSRATINLSGLKNLTTQHQRLAEIIEMIHTASLIHDDVLDDSDIRRGKATIHQLYGTRVAVLAGDFMFAQSSWYLANLENIEVIKLISQVIKDFASGEIKQAGSLFDCDVTLDDYLMKSYYKTASLVAASTKAAAIFSGVTLDVCEEMYNYGKNLGLSFQVVDDILDFTQSAEQLGKPAGCDLAKGNLTALVIFALEKEPKLREIIDSEFCEDNSLETAIKLIHKCGGIERAQELAKEKAVLALKNLQCLPDTEFRSSLEGTVRYNLQRID